MTHLVWAPPAWLPQARATLAGLHDRHPARTILLVPEPRRATRDHGVASASTRSQVDGSREALRGGDRDPALRCGDRAPGVDRAAAADLRPAGLLPLARRARRGGRRSSPSSLGVVDRLVVDSSEWRGLPAAYERLAELFERVAVSDIAFSRTLAWRARLAELWPGIAAIERLGVEGPQGGCAAARRLAAVAAAARDRALAARCRRRCAAVRVDGKPVEPPVGEARQRQRPPLGRAGRLRPRPDLRGGRAARSSGPGARATGSRDVRRSSTSCRRPFDEIALPPSIRGGAGAVGEPPAGLLDDDLHRGEIPDGHADRVDARRRLRPRRRACAAQKSP